MVDLREYISISKAAIYLKVSRKTLYEWEKLGKIIFLRHPITDRRLISIKELEDLFKEFKSNV